MGVAKCHFWLKTEKTYYCVLARTGSGEGMVTFALASAVIKLFTEMYFVSFVDSNRIPYLDHFVPEKDLPESHFRSLYLRK